MKNTFLAGLFCLVQYSLYSQNNIEYRKLIQKGDSFRQERDFKNAAIAYSAAIRIGGSSATNDDRWNAACYWMSANYADSALEQLTGVATSKNLTLEYIKDITTDDECFSALHKNQRWKDIKETMFLNIWRKYEADLKAAVGNDFSRTRNPKEVVRALEQQPDSILMHLNEPAFTFLKKKMYDQARKYVKAGVDNFPQNYWVNQHMGDIYKAMGDSERAFAYYSRALNVKYRNSSVYADTTLSVVKELTSDYDRLSGSFHRRAVPSDLLLFIASSRLLQMGKLDAAYTLAEMNMKYHPHSGRANRSISNYYNKKGDKLSAEEHLKKALIFENDLPYNFFDSSFNAYGFIKSKYENISKQRSGKVLPPEGIVSSLANQFMIRKMFRNAEQLYSLNIQNYPYSSGAYTNMSACYKAMGNNEKEELHKMRAQELKKNPVFQSSSPREVMADTSYDVSVASPVCIKNCPVIWFDEAHNNYHTASGRYKPLANLLSNDGFEIVKGLTPITKRTLVNTNLVLIAAPGHISNDELNILNAWIRQGGSLFTVTDHSNFGFDGLLESLGVGTPETEYTEDSIHARILEDGITKNPRHLVFSEKDNLLGDHPIIKGRNDSERVKIVKSFSGRTIIAPPGSSVLLRLGESAVDYLTIEPLLRTVETSVAVQCKGQRVYGVAFELGKGKVVVVSEAAMLTAQIWMDGTPGAGMNVPGSNNKQFALNIVRWLTGYLK